MNKYTPYDYPNKEVVLNNRVTGYLTAALRAGVYAVREILNSEPYLEVLQYDKIPVDMEAPVEAQRYPYIHVMYQSRSIQPVALNETSYGQSLRDDEKFDNDEFHIYKFYGSYKLNIYANTILERERISDCLIGAVGIDDDFAKLLVNNEWIAIAPNMHTLDTTSSNESWGTPWSADVMTAFRQFSFDVTGEFCYRKGTIAEYLEVIKLKHIEALANATTQPDIETNVS